jgi:hypothetical protein
LPCRARGYYTQRVHIISLHSVEAAWATFKRWSKWDRTQAIGVYKTDQPYLAEFAKSKEKTKFSPQDHGNGTIVWGAFFAYAAFRYELRGQVKQVSQKLLESVNAERVAFAHAIEEASEFHAAEMLKQDLISCPQPHLQQFVMTVAIRGETEMNLLPEAITAAGAVLDIVLRALHSAQEQ